MGGLSARLRSHRMQAAEGRRAGANACCWGALVTMFLLSSFAVPFPRPCLHCRLYHPESRPLGTVEYVDSDGAFNLRTQPIASYVAGEREGVLKRRAAHMCCLWLFGFISVLV